MKSLATILLLLAMTLFAVYASAPRVTVSPGLEKAAQRVIEGTR
jgi:hypothetical protein